MDEGNPKLKSQENLEKIKALGEELSFDGLRLMLDPQKPSSPESVFEDVLLYLQDKKAGRPKREIIRKIEFN